MDLRQLRYFCTIATEGQVTRAAKKLHIAQPPLSQSLKALEEELEVTLFERNGRKMELTEPGMVLYKNAIHLFNQLDQTIMEVKEVGQGVKGTLSIGCVKSCFSHMPRRIKAFREMYPGITFELREGDSYLLSEQLKNRDIDLAIVRMPLDIKDFSVQILPNENYLAVIPETWNTHTSRTTITLDDLANLPLLLLHRISGTGQYELIIDMFDKHGLKPNIIVDCPDVDMILKLVSEEVGATIIPASSVSNNHIKGVKMLKINDVDIISESAVIWLKDYYLSKSAQRFIELFRQEIEQYKTT